MKAGTALTDIRTLDELSRLDTPVHRRHPLAHLLVTLAFVAAAASWGKHELSAMLPLLLYPVSVMSIGEIPAGAVLRRVVPALPFAAGVGILNPVFDRATVAVVAGVAMSGGWVSFASIVLRCCLTVAAALLLVAVCGLGGVSRSLRILRVPKLIVSLLLMTFRYIHVLGGEAVHMALAYRLRAPGRKGVAYRHWGPFAGQWLLRSLARSDRLHRAMLCRGYTGEMPAAQDNPFGTADLAYVLAWAAFFLAARVIDIPRDIGALILKFGG